MQFSRESSARPASQREIVASHCVVGDVHTHHPQLPIGVFSMHDDFNYAEHMLSVGANGYVMKIAPSSQLLFALRHVLDGHIYVSEAVGNRMIQKFACACAAPATHQAKTASEERHAGGSICRGGPVRQVCTKRFVAHRLPVARPICCRACWI